MIQTERYLEFPAADLEPSGGAKIQKRITPWESGIPKLVLELVLEAAQKCPLDPHSGTVQVEEGLETAFQDIDALGSSIKARGGALVQEPMDQLWGVRDLKVADPDGFQITIYKTL